MIVCVEFLTCPCGSAFNYEYRGTGAHRTHCDICRTASKRVARWQSAHPEYKKQIDRGYYERNREHIKARSALWAIENRERKNALERERTARNQDRTRAIRRSNELTRRARKRDAFVERVDCLVVFERDAGVCQICSTPIGDSTWHIDHIVPLVRGGDHSYTNVQLAHSKCNLQKGARVSL